MAQEVGPQVMQQFWSEATFDWATQSQMDGNVVVAQLLHPHNLPFHCRHHSYPMFGATAHGYGGVSITPTYSGNLAQAGEQLVYKVNLYPAGWVHYLKGMGLPPTVVPKNCTNKWVTSKRAKLQSIIRMLRGSPSASYLGGCRVEVRTKGVLTTWPHLEQWLGSTVRHIMSCCVAYSIPAVELLQAASIALDAASDAGLFSGPASATNLALAPWRRAQYYRLLQVLGLTNVYWSKTSLHADQQGAPWGAPVLPGQAIVDQQSEQLLVNPELPDWVPRVRLHASTPKEDVAKVLNNGANRVNWLLLANFLKCPSKATVLEEVASRTRWRRAAMGRASARTFCQLTANKLVGKGVVGPLGDHLALATINLVASGAHTDVQRTA
jgi:hypothetical protein